MVQMDEQVVPAGPAPGPTRRTQQRWQVHVALIVTFVGALVALVLSRSLFLHVVIGCAFVALVGVHIVQRRQTSLALAGSLVRPWKWLGRRGRKALADAVLAFLVLNVLASGIYDGIEGTNEAIPDLNHLGGLYLSWHTLSSVLLLAGGLVHVLRRRRHFVRSYIR
ncbi:MAG TPA: hypothetical protein VL961_01765 [Acidimicrobiales bacterium]|nr:hypothetical protein [Acidimicrobiales bacterium]